MNNLSEEQTLELEKTFRLFDRDGDGTVSIRDLAVVFRSLGMAPTKSELRELITAVDEDGSGSIDFDEFVAMLIKKQRATTTSGGSSLTSPLLSTQQGSASSSSPFLLLGTPSPRADDQSEVLREVFRLLDSDSTGYLTTAQLRKAISTLGIGGSLPPPPTTHPKNGAESSSASPPPSATGGAVQLTEDDLERMINAADLDRDGKVSFEDFMSVMVPNPFRGGSVSTPKRATSSAMGGTSVPLPPILTAQPTGIGLPNGKPL